MGRFAAFTARRNNLVRQGSSRPSNIVFANGVKASNNAALVAKSSRIIDDLGGRVATVDEARELLGIT